MRVLIISWEYPPYVVGGLGKHVAEPTTVPSVKAMEAGPSRRFHQGGMIFVEGTLLRRHALVVAPRLRDHHHCHVVEWAPGQVQKLQRVVDWALSEPSGSMICCLNFSRSVPNSSEWSTDWRAYIQLILPRIVLISPLWIR